jgi:heparan-alpha-glucosaminide N-acetyltransferase-like protein
MRESTSLPANARLMSLDVFRGATVAGMLLVNNIGSKATVHSSLRHAEWHGWTFADVIFPCFLWIMGVAMTLSFDKRAAQGARYAEAPREGGSCQAQRRGTRSGESRAQRLMLHGAGHAESAPPDLWPFSSPSLMPCIE